MLGSSGGGAGPTGSRRSSWECPKGRSARGPERPDGGCAHCVGGGRKGLGPTGETPPCEPCGRPQLRGPGPTCVPFAPSRGLCDVSAARPRDGGLDCAPSLLTARSFFFFFIPNYIPIRKAPKGMRVLAWRRAELRREVSAASGAGAWSPHQRPGPRRADGGRLGRRALSHTDLCMCCSPPRSCAGKRSATSSTPRLPPAEADDASLVSGVLPLSRLDCKRCSTAASVSMVTRGDPALPLAAFPGRFPAGQSDGGGGCAVSARRATDGSGDLAAPAGS